MQKPKINEIVIVEGRDDTRAVLEAVDCRTIETHGFGISRDTWNLIEKAYHEKGIIVFTDPDFTGNEIRKRILSKFPDAKEAFLSRSDATKADDIGIENGKPEEIRKALSKAKATERSEEDVFTDSDIVMNGLSGRPDSRERRESLGKILGIGYGNSKTFLKKLNAFSVTREEFEEGLKKI